VAAVSEAGELGILWAGAFTAVYFGECCERVNSILPTKTVMANLKEELLAAMPQGHSSK
jgi:hypothetical protein